MRISLGLISCCVIASLLLSGSLASRAVTENAATVASGPHADFVFPPSVSNQLVSYPNAETAFICGPQLKIGSSLNPFPWFDKTEREQGVYHAEHLPRIAPIGPMTFAKNKNEWINVIAGRVSVSQGGTIVTGRGTRFTLDVDPNGPAPRFNGHLRIRDATGVERSLKVRSVESDTRLILTTPWSFASVNNALADTFWDDHSTYGANVDHYYVSNYYDTALVQYINYYRTGDPKFLAYARRTVDAFWHSMWIGDGTTVDGINHLPPRSQAFAGLMLRALDGKPEYWDYLYREVRATFDHWLKIRRNDPSLYGDIREDGYAQLYAVMLARVLPDRYPLYAHGTLMPATGMTDGAQRRAALLADTEDLALNFFGRLQKPDGSWRWNVDAGSNIEQPFMVGLYLESAILLHQLTNRPTVKANLRDQIVRSCRHLFRDAYRANEVVRDLPQYRWRGMWYFWSERRISNDEYKQVEVDRLSKQDPGWIRYVRHLNSTIHHAFGYAFAITGDREFLRMGDEIFDASYGETDGIHCFANSGKAKDYDMNFRASGHYLAWRLATPLTTRPRVTAAKPD